MTTTDLPADWIEKPCDVEGCDYVAHGAASGRLSANMRLGAHKRGTHGIVGTKRRKKGDQPVVELDLEKPALSIVQGTAEAIGQTTGRTRKGAPSVEDLSRGLGRGLGLCTIAVASYFAETDPTIAWDESGEAQREALVDYLSLDEKSSREVMTPIARAIAPTSINKRFGRQIVDNVDAVASIADIATLAIRYRHYLRQRNLRVAAMEGRVVDVPATNGAGPVIAPAAAGPSASPPPQNGHVVGFDEVQRARGGT